MTRRIFTATTLAVALLFAGTAQAHERAKFHDDMRTLWTDHVVWTRLFIISAVNGLPDQEVTTKRLLQNQADIGNAVAQFYGREAGDKLTALLKDHILIAASIVTAAKAGDNVKVASENVRWQKNSDDIAEFLHAANPKHWPLASLKSMMRMHLDQTLQEATHRLKGDYASEVKGYDEVVHHILQMADVLSDGIIRQFPAKFAGSAR